MREYGKVHTSFWSSPTIRALSEDARTLALYLITSPHSNIAGVFRLPDGYVCEDLEWNSERVSKGFAELFANGYANRCETTKWVWVSKHFEWNPPENPNQRKSIAKIVLSIPDGCGWKLDFMRVCGSLLGIKTDEKANPFETLSKPFLNQEQEQEQEQELDAPPSASPASTKKQEAAQGTRLPKDWELPEDWKSWAAKERPDLDAESVAEGFRDFWIAKPGKDGRKADWQATWRNWCRSQKASAVVRKSADVGSFV